MIRLLFLIAFSVFSLWGAEERFSMEKLNEEVRDPMSYSAERDSLAREEVSPVFVVFRIIGSLALLSVLVVGVVWGLRKTGFASQVASVQEGSLELLQDLQTGAGNSLVLVRFDKKVLLLGQTGSSITLLETVEGDTATGLIAESAGGRSVGTFKANLNKYVTSLQKGNKGA